MKINVISGDLKKLKGDVIIVGIYEGGQAPLIDKSVKSSIAAMIKNKQFKGEYGEFQAVSTLGSIGFKNIIIAGLGKKAEWNIERLRRVSGMAAKYARSIGAKVFSSTLCSAEGHIKEKTQAITEGTILSLYRFTEYKTDKTGIKNIDSFSIIVNKNELAEAKKSAEQGSLITDATNYARDIVNTPANTMTPQRLAGEAKKIAKKSKLKIKIFNGAQMKKMGMNALLGVSMGSTQEPKFIVLEYGKKKKGRSIVIVGKGITFDSGGLDIKPAVSMETMKEDKAGAAAVLGVMKILAKLGVHAHVIGIIPACENMPSGNALKPGDIVTAYNKKTIEVVNTDAEGRLVLADALSYAEKTFKPDYIIDIATLTGATVIALGYYAASLLGTDERLIKKIIEAGEQTGERVWQLPLWNDYKELVKGDVGDVKNSTKGMALGPGVINGASFLSNFVEKTPWAHIDIGGTAWFNEEKEYIPRDATGYGVRLLAKFIMNMK
ncbi:MAG: leucyl aminopeptidase [Candidatus Aenigmatarchaeota archaeon]